MARVLVAGAVAASALMALSASAKAATVFPTFYLSDQFNTGASTVVQYGDAGDIGVSGHWTVGSADTYGVFRRGVFYLATASGTLIIPFGDPTDKPITGDWNSDGITDVGVFRDGAVPHFYLRYSSTRTDDVTFGAAGDSPITGDWNGDGKSSIGVWRAGVFHLSNKNTTGGALADAGTFSYGSATGDLPVTGDWNADGKWTIGVVRGSSTNTPQWLLSDNPATGLSNIGFYYGDPGDIPITGDWNGDHRTTQGSYRVPATLTSGNVTVPTFLLSNQLGGVSATIAGPLGNPGDTPVVGHWSGAGHAMSYGVYRAGVFYLKTATTTITIPMGDPGDLPITGDWDGDGTTDVGVFRDGAVPHFFLRYSSTRTDDVTFGAAGDSPITGDWNGDGRFSIGVVRTNMFHLSNKNTTGGALPDAGTYGYGNGTGDVPVTGDWNADGRWTIGVVRGTQWLLTNDSASGVATITPFTFGDVGDRPVAGDWDGDGTTTHGVYRMPPPPPPPSCSSAPGVGDNVTRWTPVVNCVLGMLGQQSASNINGVLVVIRCESGGNPNAINLTDINAQQGHPSKGLVQVIDPTFTAYRSSILPNNIYDPAANIYAGMNYGVRRYGSIANLPAVRTGTCVGY